MNLSHNPTANHGSRQPRGAVDVVLSFRSRREFRTWRRRARRKGLLPRGISRLPGQGH
jgi:hypothetical protein